MAQVLTCPPAMKVFPGFSPEALNFLRNLRRNNRNDWFQPRKEQYETLLKKPLLDLACCLSREFARFSPAYVTPPDRSVFRIYRDANFSHNRKPFKTHLAAGFARQGAERMRGPCFYFHFTERELVALGGAYLPEPDEMRSYRELISENHQELEAILAKKTLRQAAGELEGEQLSRVPRGYCPGHPAAGLLRRKQWYLVAVLDHRLLTTSRLLPELSRHFEAMAPFVEFLGRPFHKSMAGRSVFLTAAGPQGCH